MSTYRIGRVALAAITCTTALGMGSTTLAQSTEDAPTLRDDLQPRTVIRMERPIYTYRGEAVRIGGNNDNLHIGVVRPIRDTPYDDSRVIRHRRVIVNAYPDAYYRYGRPDESIGVVRPYRTYDPPQRAEIVVYRNANAEQPDDGPAATNTLNPDNPSVYSVRRVSDLPEAQQSDPWALLNAGFYRDARALFAERDASPANQTGQALAAALSGDVQAGSDLMPNAPTLPEGVALSTATKSRIDQSADLFYGDDQPTREALKTLAGTAQNDSIN